MYIITIWCGGVEWNEMAPDKIMNRVMKLRFPCKVGCTVQRKEENPCEGWAALVRCAGVSTLGLDTRRLAVCRNSAENLS